jgi:hypothetical protein
MLCANKFKKGVFKNVLCAQSVSIPINFRYTNLLFLLYNTQNKPFKINCQASVNPFVFLHGKLHKWRTWRECDILWFHHRLIVLLFMCTILLKYRFLSYSHYRKAHLWLMFECNVIACAEKLPLMFPMYILTEAHIWVFLEQNAWNSHQCLPLHSFSFLHVLYWL